MTRKTATPPTWITLTKITMEGEERKVLIRANSPIRIEEVVVRMQPLIHSVIRWLPHCHNAADDEKPLFACETVEEILHLINGTQHDTFHDVLRDEFEGDPKERKTK